MWNALTTVLIVACPCALLLASNYANGNVLKIFGKNSFYIRDASVLMQLQNINHIVFDKTGTLTHSQHSRIIYSGKIITNETQNIVCSVLANSNHPLSKMLLQYFNDYRIISVEHFKEQSGLGIEAWINDQHIKIGSPLFVNLTDETNPSNTSVYIKIDKEVLGKFEIANAYRKNIFSLLQQLKQNFKLSILSGDNDAEANRFNKIIQNSENIKFNQSPLNKLAYIEKLQQQKGVNVAMVGDGLNDAGALKISNVGIAISDGANNFTPSCDAVLDAKHINLLPSFFRLAKANATIIFFTFCVSAIYNVVGLCFAVQGSLSPVIAAILMPISSVSIIGLTYSLTRFMAKKYHLKT
jgi:Cu+-exporting ATPase